MAQVTTTKLVEGNSHLIIRIDLLSDGTGELQNYVVLSPSDLDPPRPNNNPAFRIMQLWYGQSLFDTFLGFGTLQPVNVWTIAKDCDSHVDFRSFGGLVDLNTTPPSDDNGRFWISTKGFAAPGSQGTMVVELKKINTTNP
ncbi:MAG: hypothetical protein EBY16_04620 [Gammaproteobacteria bacterium]|nr:hypothetical protein [Gammaproteobacteria bacterium]